MTLAEKGDGPRNLRGAAHDNARMSATYSRLYVHLVWTTFERRPVLTSRRAPRLHGLLRRICDDTGCVAMAVGGVEDHVHMLVGLHTTVAVAALVRELKANTSQFVERTLGVPGFCWQDGYGAFTLRADECEVVRSYVRNQPEHHARGTLVDDWERTERPPTARPR